MIAMNGYQSTLLGRTEVAEHTMAFQFEKPKGFVFKPGQYIDLTVSDSQPGPSNELTHTFSIASPPFDEEILVTTRMRNTVFKQALSTLPIDSGAWKGKTGHIRAEMLSTQVGIVRGPIYYIAGPPTMVAATRRTLSEVGVDEDDIRTEEFAGY